MVRRVKDRAAIGAAVLSMLLAVPVSIGATPAQAAPSCKKQQQCSTDTTAPTVGIVSPAAGATVSGTTTVSGTSSDNVSVAKVEVSLGAGPFKVATGTGSWSISIDTRTYANGGQTIVARATDASGNTASTSRTVTVSNASADIIAPSVAVSGPTTGSTVAGAVTVSGSASDNAAVSRIDVAVDGGAWSPAGGTTAWSWNWSTSTAANGSHTVTARATDSSGNTGTTSVTVTVSNGGDTTPPSVSMSSPASGATVSSRFTVSGTAGDNVAVASVQVAVDGGAWQMATGTASWSWSWDTTALPNGAHSVAVRAVDGAGNVSATVTRPVTVANQTAPLAACSDGSPVLEQTVTPEGARIAICSSVGGWTTGSIYNLLQPNALDLSVIGPHLMIQVQTGTPSSTGSSASCCDAGGHYYGFGAIIVLNPSTTSTFSAAPDAIMAHEYGHAWTYYWLYMNPANGGNWTAYHQFRWAAAGGTQVLAQHPSLNTSYTWMDYEMAADDYRRLFGTPVAQSQLSFLNSRVPDSQQVTGLADFFRNTWR